MMDYYITGPYTISMLNISAKIYDGGDECTSAE